ncbi:hypothetical protein BA896_023360 [Janthinobacterium lividum]|uniref:Response regulatory domain-containing protein n=1 Tax=Janthinobacterium lividum TaxID=29581 RepID=A0A1E8PPP7_9BURK|nr:hypothetical protein BA896_023360 [Janthinobacterium lividum]
MTTEAQAPPLRLQRLSGLHVLVIDDNAMNLQVARELLLHEGAEVSVANGGALGLSMALEAEPVFDAVLLDIQMPEMDGYACAMRMRSSMRLRSTPIIAMTANVMARERDACMAAGMDAHMGKPIDIDMMVDLLQTHCQASLAQGLSRKQRTRRHQRQNHCMVSTSRHSSTSLRLFPGSGATVRCFSAWR